MELRTKPLADDGSSHYIWKLYAPDVTQETIELDFEEPEGRQIYSMYDCTGRAFAHSISIRRTKTRTLVKQYWGIDI